MTGRDALLRHAAVRATADGRPSRHPNELDLRRIERALRDRDRYRYVRPRVVAENDGYRIESPCCSRNIDPEGGVIDIALLRWSESPPGWQLYRKDHAAGAWAPAVSATRLADLLARLNADPDRSFWQ